MNKRIVVSVVLLLVSVACFSAAGFSYWTMNNLYKGLKVYGLEGQYYTHEKLRETVLGLRLGIIRFSLGGLVAAAAAVVLLVRRNRMSN